MTARSAVAGNSVNRPTNWDSSAVTSASPSAALRAWTASAPVRVLTEEIVTIDEAIDPAPRAASLDPRDISSVVAVCSSTALAIVVW